MTAAKLAEDLIKRRWSPEEDSVLARVWPRGSVSEILAMLPGRSIRSCGRRAHELQIKCESRQHFAKVVSPIFVRDGVAGKACVECLEWKPIEKFSRHATCAEGRRNICTRCEGRTSGAKYYANNREACIERSRKYQRENPEKVEVIRREGRARRHARKKNGPGVTLEEYDALKAQFGGMCAYCREAKVESFDHVIPLVRGGLHAIENLLPACLDCNKRKHAKTLEEWLLLSEN